MEEFSSVWSRLSPQTPPLDPVSLLVSLVSSPKEAEDLCRKWKLSNSERHTGVFVATHRSLGYKEATPLKHFQDLLVDGSSVHHVTEVLRYCGRDRDAKVIEQWTIPVLPVTGKDLKEAGLQAGPQMGRTLKFIKEKWKDSFYCLSKQELLEIGLQKR